MAEREIFGLVDERFAHDQFTVAGVVPFRLAWDRSLKSKEVPTFFSHEKMFEVPPEMPRRFRFGLLFESVSQAEVYRNVRSVVEDFSLVFTHSSSLLKEFSNTRWIPGGGVWVGGKRGGIGLPQIFPKTRNISLISSNKSRCKDHRMRYQLALQLERSSVDLDVYRQIRGGGESPVQVFSKETTEIIGFPVAPLDYLQNYRYSIVTENFVDDLYFTEKILNCFATGTVPVYRGARQIASIFDERGIIPWENPAVLVEEIIPSLHSVDYLARMKAIENNFKLAMEFRTIEDYIVTNYLEEIKSFV